MTDATVARCASFRSRLHARELLIGTWIKTPSPVVCEVLSASSLHVLALDAEHAPFGRAELDACLGICSALDMPTLVRVPAADHAQVLNALDCGATGVLIPHVSSVAIAQDAVRMCHFGKSGRGYAGSTRAARFGAKSIPTHLRDSAATTTVIAQIEDAQALDVIDAIARVPGIDCLFVGRVDLTISLGKTRTDDPEVVRAVENICEAARAAAVPVGMFVADPSEAKIWAQRGASLFILSSDHGFLLSGAKSLVNTVQADSA